MIFQSTIENFDPAYMYFLKKDRASTYIAKYIESEFKSIMHERKLNFALISNNLIEGKNLILYFLRNFVVNGKKIWKI